MPDVIRRKTVTALVGKVRVGSDAPVVVQSMTNTDTADIPGTIEQVAALAVAGSSKGCKSAGSMCRSWATSTTTGICC
jgi:hypothetical protein